MLCLLLPEKAFNGALASLYAPGVWSFENCCGLNVEPVLEVQALREVRDMNPITEQKPQGRRCLAEITVLASRTLMNKRHDRVNFTLGL